MKPFFIFSSVLAFFYAIAEAGRCDSIYPRALGGDAHAAVFG
jgi:hypothetical protein